MFINYAVELAPNHKHSLTLTNPIIAASGQLGLSGFGATITPPLTLRSRRGAPEPRVVEVPGGMLLRTGGANQGLVRFLRIHERILAASRTPNIVAFAAQGVNDWPEMAARVERVSSVNGIELALNPTIQAGEAIRAVRSATELPIVAKLELEDAAKHAPLCVESGANALVIGRPPRGMVLVSGEKWYGRLYAPMVKPLALRALSDVAALNLGAPLVGCGGVYTQADVEDFLAAGAVAVEVDSAVWLNPAVASELVARATIPEHPAGP